MITENQVLSNKSIEHIVQRYTYTRNLSEKICQPLKTEDYVVQPITDVSPPKWHLGHTTWFFETFVLSKMKGYKPFHDDFSFLFNSYYESVGERVLRSNRGNMSRPTVEEIYEYRKHVDEKLVGFLCLTEHLDDELINILEIGINHEQQHQELLLTDIKYIFGHNPLFPTYNFSKERIESFPPDPIKFLKVKGGLYEIGHTGNDFCYDNELSLHIQHINDFTIADRVVSNGEFLEFIEDGGYSNFSFWLSEGWEWVKLNGIKAPLYWHFHKGEWYEYTLSGFAKVNLHSPVTHVSYFEADAYASWKKLRLPTEFEWEVAAKTFENDAQPLLLESNVFHPEFEKGNYQLMGNVWEWTSSSYTPSPGFKKAEGALGEYNGKFMINQNVLRGGSVATPNNHIRKTYRNFFHPHLRWQFTGIRLAQ